MTKMIIDVPDAVIDDIKATYEGLDVVYNAVKFGKVLQKGHKRLIDADKLIKSIEKKSKRLKNLDTINGLCGAVAIVFDAPTIIEADEVGDTDGNS